MKKKKQTVIFSDFPGKQAEIISELWQNTESTISEQPHTKELLFRSIFPANGPQVVPTGSGCRLWIFRSPSFWNTSSSPADNKNKRCLEYLHVCFTHSHLFFVCLLYTHNILGIHIKGINYACLKTNWSRYPERKIKLVLVIVFRFSPISSLHLFHTHHLQKWILFSKSLRTWNNNTLPKAVLWCQNGWIDKKH